MTGEQRQAWLSLMKLTFWQEVQLTRKTQLNMVNGMKEKALAASCRGQRSSRKASMRRNCLS